MASPPPRPPVEAMLELAPEAVATRVTRLAPSIRARWADTAPSPARAVALQDRLDAADAARAVRGRNWGGGAVPARGGRGCAALRGESSPSGGMTGGRMTRAVDAARAARAGRAAARHAPRWPQARARWRPPPSFLQRFLAWVAAKARPRPATNPPAALSPERLDSRLAAAACARAARLARVAAAGGVAAERGAAAAARRLAKAAAEERASARREAGAAAAVARRGELLAARAERARGAARRPSPPVDLEAAVAALRASHAVRKIAAGWRRFAATSRRSAALAADFARAGVLRGPDDEAESSPPPAPDTPPRPLTPTAVLLGPGAAPPPPRRTPFDDFADTLRSPATLRATRALLARLEAKQGGISGVAKGASLPRRCPRPPRYRHREFLCAFMLLHHPDVVLRANGTLERSLAAAAGRMRTALAGALAALLPEGSLPPAVVAHMATDGVRPTQAAAIASFDAAWTAYAAAFASWKVADAATLEAELTRAAADLEASRLAVEAGRLAAAAADGPAARRGASSDDAAELAAAVDRDLALLRARASTVAGPAAGARLDAAVAAARARGEATASDSESGGGAAADSVPPPSRFERVAWSVVLGGARLEKRAAAAAWAAAVGGAPAGDAATLSAAADAAAADAAALVIFGDEDARLAADVAADAARWAAVRLALERGGPRARASVAAALATIARRLLALLASLIAPGAPAGPKARAERELLEEVASVEALSAALDGGDATTTPIPGLALPAALAMLDRVVASLLRLCAPSRDAELAAAAGESRAALAAAAAAADPSALALALATALRRADAGARATVADDVSFAGGYYGAPSLARGAGRAALARRGAAPTDAASVDEAPDAPLLAARLPLTRAWLAAACGALAAVEGGLPQGAAREGSPTPAAPRMRSGRSTADGGTPNALSDDSLLPLEPAERGGWRAAARVGLVALAAAPDRSAAAPPPAPELITPLDAILAPAVAEFQILTVCAAGCMLVAGAPRGSRPRAPPAAVAARVRTALTSPDAPDIAMELVDLAGGDRGNPSAVDDMRAGVGRLLRPAAPAARALAAALAAALHARLLLAPGAAADAAVAAALARCGALALGREADALAARLGRAAAALEAAHAETLPALCQGLL